MSGIAQNCVNVRLNRNTLCSGAEVVPVQKLYRCNVNGVSMFNLSSSIPITVVVSISGHMNELSVLHGCNASILCVRFDLQVCLFSSF